MKLTSDPDIRLFDEIIMAKKGRGRTGLPSSLSRLSTLRGGGGTNSWGLSPSGRSNTGGSGSGAKIPPYLGDTSEHIWRTASVPLPKGNFPGEYHTIVTRMPARLDRSLMREPRAIQGVPRIEPRGPKGVARKQVPNMLGGTPQ